MLTLSLPRSWKLWRRRVSAAVLLVLHVLIAGSQLLEPVTEVRLDTHAEQHGNKHPFAHDATTCAVCSIQLQQSTLPARPTFAITEWIRPAAVVTDVARPVRAAQLRIVSLRAPPARS
ncbi:DUF2946 domain-containing protein [bacterium]|nr:DUF2946 domain-containing protein [bacterium]